MTEHWSETLAKSEGSKSKLPTVDWEKDFNLEPIDETPDMVSQPSHYADSEIECIDAMVAAFGRDNVNIYAEIASFKYVWRMNKKNDESKQDKRKAVWYLRYSMNDDPRTKE